MTPPTVPATPPVTPPTVPATPPVTPPTVPVTPPTTLPTGLLGFGDADGPAGLTVPVELVEPDVVVLLVVVGFVVVVSYSSAFSAEA